MPRLHNGVDDARELVERSSFAPVAGRYRIFILDECHQLATQSQNALLKCIEEPPPHVVFVLCTTEAHKVLPTIASRCQRFEFRALSTGTITTQLRKVADTEEISIGDDALSAIARIVNGGLRDALQLLSQVRLLGEGVTANQVIEMAGGTTESELLAIVEAIATGNTLQLLQAARVLVDAGKTPTLILNSLLQTYRDLLILQSAPKEQSLLTGVVSYRQLKLLAAKCSFDTLNLVLAQLHKAELQLRQSINAGVWLEVCLLNLMSATQQEPQPIFPKLSTTTAEPTLNEIWQQAIDTAKSNNRMLLSKATLVKLNGSKATLEVAPTYLEKFEANKEAIARLLQRVTQHPKPITVFVRTAVNANGRSNRRLSA
jgi:DNA polymerase-3 subunit gamma/tau